NLFLIVQLHFSKLFLILKSGVNHTSRGSISTSTLPSIKLRKCSSKIITSILSFISGRLATKSNQIKQLIRNGRSASLQRTFKKSFTSFSHSTRNKTRDGLISCVTIDVLPRTPGNNVYVGFMVWSNFTATKCRGLVSL